MKKQLFIQRQWCTGCRTCVAFCPKQVLDIDEEGKVYAKHPDKCIYCKLCELRCPDLAIEVREGEEGGAAVAEGNACSCAAPAKPKRKKA